MSRTQPISVTLIATALLLCAGVAGARSLVEVTEPSQARDVDLVIALDVSTSMNGLIASAKQRLWDVVNELGRAQPQPNLRVAIITYGNPDYGAQSGFVSIDQPFTSDLDAVNDTLFGFSTNGGDEYVARAVNTALHQLDWSASADALRTLFVAGNEGAEQDPMLSTRAVMAVAAGKGITVNTIYCGTDNDGDATSWKQVAALTNGLYAAIDQNAAAVANIATPMDADLIGLNDELNATYIAYGPDGDAYRENQAAQDANAGAMSAATAASRTVAKASRLYDSSHWDIVAAYEAGKDIEELDAQHMPEPMQEMSVDEREAFVREQSAKRETLRAEIAALDRQRRDYIEGVRAAGPEPEVAAFDEIVTEGLRTLAEDKGFTFD